MVKQVLRSLVVLLIYQLLGVHAGTSLAQPSSPAVLSGQHRLRQRSLTTQVAFPQVQSVDEPSEGVGTKGCKLLQQAMLVQPKASCEEVQLYGKWEGCSCTVSQPRTLNPWPNTFFDPSAIRVDMRQDMPTFPPIAALPPANDPRDVYVAPKMDPKCPFSRKCADRAESSDCVGFDSWGFHSMRMEPYTAAAGHWNYITCAYMMDKHGSFQVPQKVAALWKSQKESKKESEK